MVQVRYDRFITRFKRGGWQSWQFSKRHHQNGIYKHLNFFWNVLYIRYDLFIWCISLQSPFLVNFEKKQIIGAKHNYINNTYIKKTGHHDIIFNITVYLLLFILIIRTCWTLRFIWQNMKSEILQVEHPRSNVEGK